MKVKIVNVTAVMKTMTQTVLFHPNTFDPSSMPKGMRLKEAIHALKAAPNIETILGNDLNGYAKIRNRIESIMLVKGPAMAVFPPISLLIGPAIITAPGEISLIGETIESKVMRAPNMFNRNSAHNP